jgi:hypothetical protein
MGKKRDTCPRRSECFVLRRQNIHRLLSQLLLDGRLLCCVARVEQFGPDESLVLAQEQRLLSDEWEGQFWYWPQHLLHQPQWQSRLGLLSTPHPISPVPVMTHGTRWFSRLPRMLMAHRTLVAWRVPTTNGMSLFNKRLLSLHSLILCYRTAHRTTQ